MRIPRSTPTSSNATTTIAAYAAHDNHITISLTKQGTDRKVALHASEFNGVC